MLFIQIDFFKDLIKKAFITWLFLFYANNDQVSIHLSAQKNLILVQSVGRLKKQNLPTKGAFQSQ